MLTAIEKTILPGENSITLSEDVDWQPGEDIVVASTSYDHTESEKVTIESISNRIVTISGTFSHKHLSVV